MCIFLNENCCILINFSLKYVRKGPINNITALVQIMAWRRPGDKPLSEPIMVNLLTHISVTRPQWVKLRFRWSWGKKISILFYPISFSTIIFIASLDFEATLVPVPVKLLSIIQMEHMHPHQTTSNTTQCEQGGDWVSKCRLIIRNAIMKLEPHHSHLYNGNRYTGNTAFYTKSAHWV